MSRPNLVLELGIIKGLNQIRRNLGRVSSSYLELSELNQVTVSLANMQTYTIGACTNLVLKCSGPVRVEFNSNSNPCRLDVEQLLTLDASITDLVITNTQAEEVQVILIFGKS